MTRLAGYLDVVAMLLVFAACLAAYLVQGDDVTRGLVVGSFSALLAILRPPGSPSPPQAPSGPLGGP